MRFTQANIEALTLPKGKSDLILWDPALPGFGVRVRPTSKTWRAQYRVAGRQRSESLGDVRKVKLEAARKIARGRFALVELGRDPQDEIVQARGALTLAATVTRYLDFKRGRLRRPSFEAAQRHLQLHWRPLHGYPIDSIKRADVAAELQTIAKERGPIAAQRARANLSALFAWACKEGLLDTNVVINTNDPGAGRPSRDRVLSPDEIKRIWLACEDCGSFGDIVRLLLLTGQRRCEISDARWGEADFDKATLTLPPVRTKNGRQHVVSLSAPALAILKRIRQRGADGDRVFDTLSWTHSKAALDRKIADLGVPLQHWTLHDARRSVATHMAEIGIQPHVVEQVLNHQSGHKAGTAGTYNKSTYSREVTAALLQWAEFVLALVEMRKQKVVSIRA